MATTVSYTLIHTLPSHNNINVNTNSLSFPASQSPSILHLRCRRRTRRLSTTTVSRAGATTGQFILAFVFPFSLLAITAFAAFRIGNRLDQKFLEELAMNEALREAEEEDDELSEAVTSRKEEPALPRSRNRPIREV